MPLYRNAFARLASGLFAVVLQACLALPLSADVFDNVPEALIEGYELVYTLPIPDQGAFGASGSVPYSVDRSASVTGPFDRIAYYLELDDGSGLEFAYASMDAFTNEVTHTALPIESLGIRFQQPVKNMNVVSNSSAVNEGTAIATGNIEFWPNNYGVGNVAAIPNASDSAYDFGDTETPNGSYGSFQVHDHGAGQTIMAYNQWGGFAPTTDSDLGMGNRPATNPDWTFAANASSYNVKNLQVLVRPAGLSIDTDLSRAIFQRNAQNQASVPIAGLVTSAATSIEARATPRLGSQGAATPWQILDSSPMGGTYSGQLLLFAGWYDLEVRSLNGGSVLDQAEIDRVGVGEVFVIAGQSNSANFGSVPLLPADDRVSAFDLSRWRAAWDPQPIATGSGGSPWPALGDALVDALGVPVGIVSVGWGGTAVAQWVPLAPGPDAEPLFNRLRDAIQALAPNGARAVLWHQGEADTPSTTLANYLQRLEVIIAASRAEAGDDLLWSVAQATFVPPNQFNPAVIDAQVAIAANDPLTFVGASTDDLIGPTWRSADQIHFNEAGLIEHADRWFVQTTAMLQAVPEPGVGLSVVLGGIWLMGSTRGVRLASSRRGRRVVCGKSRERPAGYPERSRRLVAY